MGTGTGRENKSLSLWRRFFSYRSSLCCSGSWHLSPGGQSPGQVTQQVKVCPVQSAHSSNPHVHTKESSPASSCSCSLSHTHRNTQVSYDLYTLYPRFMINKPAVSNTWPAYWCFYMQLSDCITVHLKWSPTAGNKTTAACWSTCYAGVLTITQCLAFYRNHSRHTADWPCHTVSSNFWTVLSTKGLQKHVVGSFCKTVPQS